MSALVPSEAVALLYRRYLKAASRIPNVTIRMLLLQQIRAGFQRNRNISSPSAQRELIQQAHKDLQILEDERLSRTLFINRLGMAVLAGFLTAGFIFLLLIATHTERLDQRRPDIAEMVDLMAMRLEAESPEELRALREEQHRNALERKARRQELEKREARARRLFFLSLFEIRAPRLMIRYVREGAHDTPWIREGTNQEQQQQDMDTLRSLTCERWIGASAYAGSLLEPLIHPCSTQNEKISARGDSFLSIYVLLSSPLTYVVAIYRYYKDLYRCTLKREKQK
eukprot:gene1598-975_t